MIDSKDILAGILSELGQNTREFSDNLGYSLTKLYDVQRGKTKRLSDELIELILEKYPRFNKVWLMTGEGEMLRSSDVDPSKSTAVVQPTLRPVNKGGLPLIPIDAVAGFNGWDECGVTEMECARYTVPDFETAHADFLIRVSGSSMYPKYSSGDILACRKIDEITFLQWGKVYVIDSRQGAMVKRLFPMEGNGDMVLCKSDNPNYPPFELPKEEIRSLSIVVGAIRLE